MTSIEALDQGPNDFFRFQLMETKKRIIWRKIQNLDRYQEVTTFVVKIRSIVLSFEFQP